MFMTPIAREPFLTAFFIDGYIKLLTSFDGGDNHQESWSWVGSRVRDCSE